MNFSVTQFIHLFFIDDLLHTNSIQYIYNWYQIYIYNLSNKYQTFLAVIFWSISLVKQNTAVALNITFLIFLYTLYLCKNIQYVLYRRKLYNTYVFELLPKRSNKHISSSTIHIQYYFLYFHKFYLHTHIHIRSNMMFVKFYLKH